MQGRPTQLLTEQIQEILWSYDKGKGIHYLREKFKIGDERIKKILRDHDLMERPTKCDNLYEVDEFDGKICKGMSYRDYLKKAGYRS